MKTLLKWLTLLPVLMTFIGCGSGEGPDSISSHKPLKGGVISSCLQCHSSAISASLDPLVTNGTGTAGKHVAHVNEMGIACETCHSGYANASTHMNGTLNANVVFFDSSNPTGTWNSAVGSCSSLICHGTDTLAWYGIDGTTYLDCSTCHAHAIRMRRQVFGAAGDFASNLSVTSHHVAGTNDPANSVCRVCHDHSAHTQGAVRLKNADTGGVISYSTPSTLEPFCLSCHDADGATYTFVSGGGPTNPFNDGSVLGSPPYPYATRIASSWTKTYGHGPNGNHGVTDRLTCMGTGVPGTGCHGNNGGINAHGSVNQVLGAREFNYSNGPFYVESDYALCFTCHSYYSDVKKEDIFGVLEGGILDWQYDMSPSGGGRGANGWAPPYTLVGGVKTHFADHNEAGSPYNDASFWGTNMNLHWAHIALQTSNFRGTGAWSGINCVNCHDVHGSSTPYGAVYDEFVYTNFTPTLNYIMGQMTGSAYSTNLLDNYPTYCAFNCHSIQGPTKAWFYPITE